jgi:uncharacterized membrane protein
VFDRWLKADTSAIDELRSRMETFTASVERVATAGEFMVLLGITFAVVGLCHVLGGAVAGVFEGTLGADSTLASDFLWIVVFATTLGLVGSFTPMRAFEGIGASKFGTVFIFLLVLVIGTKMNLLQLSEAPEFMAVGGAASAPVVAGAFHPALAPVGVLLAVLGYAVGTYGAILCAELMRAI